MSRGLRFAAALLGSAALVAAPVAAKPALSAALHEQTSRPAVTAAAARVLAWQTANMADMSYVTRYRGETKDPRGWVQATLYTGVLEWALASSSRAELERVKGWAGANDYRLGSRLYHADDHAVGRIYVELVREGLVGPSALASTQGYFDAILAAPARGPLAFTGDPDGPRDPPCTDRWCWADALFMSPPAWFALSAATGDPRYAAFADQEYWAATEYLFDPIAGLFYRDSRFFERRGPGGEKLFWSRGNGWVMGGLVDILETLPKDHPSRPRYEALFRAMAAAVLGAQQKSGFWGSSLLAKDGAPEASGTAFFVYGLQRGIDMGLLPARTYRPAVARGWRALVGAIRPDGRLGYVQQIGQAPEQVQADETQLYGTGAFLLAASALYRSAADRR